MRRAERFGLHHVFALRVLQELAVEFLFAGGGGVIARETHTRRRGLFSAHVAEAPLTMAPCTFTPVPRSSGIWFILR